MRLEFFPYYNETEIKQWILWMIKNHIFCTITIYVYSYYNVLFVLLKTVVWTAVAIRKGGDFYKQYMVNCNYQRILNCCWLNICLHCGHDILQSDMQCAITIKSHQQYAICMLGTCRFMYVCVTSIETVWCYTTGIYKHIQRDREREICMCNSTTQSIKDRRWEMMHGHNYTCGCVY